MHSVYRETILEEEYTNAEGRRVTWTFERAVEIKEIIEDQFGDGVEVFSLRHPLRCSQDRPGLAREGPVREAAGRSAGAAS